MHHDKRKGVLPRLQGILRLKDEHPLPAGKNEIRALL